MQHAVQQHKLQNAICCPSILTVIIKTKILSFLNMHLVYCVDKTKLQFTSPLILFFSSLFLTASQSICVQREREETWWNKERESVHARAQCLWQQGRRGKLQLPSTCVCKAGLYHPLPHFNMGQQGGSKATWEWPRWLLDGSNDQESSLGQIWLVYNPITLTMATRQSHLGAGEGLEPLGSDLDGW